MLYQAQKGKGKGAMVSSVQVTAAFIPSSHQPLASASASI